METKFVACKSVDVPKVPGEARSFDKEFATGLADSIKVDGLLVPIAVRPNPEAPGRYILINGKHKLYAVKTILKHDLIEARVFGDMDADEAEILRTTEQLWQNPLTPAQHALSLKKWYAHWQAKLPPLPAKAEGGPSGAEGQQAISHSAKTDGPPFEIPQPAATPAKPAKPDTHKESTFDQRVADATGQSVGSVRRSKTLAKTFTDEQLEVFAQCDVGKLDMLMIARIKDQAKRAMVINLIASGQKVDEAVKAIMGDDAPQRPNETEDSKTEKTAKKEAKAAAEPELSDDEWFERYCGEKAKMLGNPHKFKADAILFRKITEARHVFRSKAKGTLKEIKKCGVSGSFWNLVNRVLSISHPKDWLICPDCKGTGHADNPTPDLAVKPPCKKCFGSGYLLKTEEYL